MNLNYQPSRLFEAIFFLLFAVNTFGWVAVSPVLLGIIALIITILILVHQ